MATIKNMNDVKLRPKLLRSLIKDYLPEDCHRKAPNSQELSYIIQTLQTFELLSEEFTNECGSEVIETWTAAVDEWIERLLILVTCEMPDKCWVGVSLLGLTCQECSSTRFLSSYSFWLDDLIPLFDQPLTEVPDLKVVCCLSISDLFTRLGGYSNAAKDGLSYAAKLVHPILKIFNDDTSESVLEAAAALLCTIITFYPSCVDCDYDIAENSIVSQIMSWRSNHNLLKRCAMCLSLLPKSRGNEESWSVMIQKLLASIDHNLNDAFEGLEDGKGIPVPSRGQEISREVFHMARRRYKQLLYVIPTLMVSCSMMLTNPYPAQITVPVDSLLTLVERVLKVDGSLYHALMPSTAAMLQEFICSELPPLHLASLDLLDAIIRAVRSQLVPHAAKIIQILEEYLKRCVLMELRIKVYNIIRIFLLNLGFGVALHISEEVISNAFIDLDVIGYGRGATSEHSKISSEVLSNLSCRKRKRADVTSSLEEHPGGALEVQAPESNSTTPPALKIAALEALETLLTVGGATRSDYLRSNVELLLINVVANAFDGELESAERKSYGRMFQCSSADFQLAALRALLACLLLPTRVGPFRLAQGLELFRKGKRVTETKITEFCAHALLVMENRGQTGAFTVTEVAYAEPSPAIEGYNLDFSGNVSPGGGQEGYVDPMSTLQSADIPDSGDDPCENWLGNDTVIIVLPTNPDENIENAKEFPDANILQTNTEDLAENILEHGLCGEIPQDSSLEQTLEMEGSEKISNPFSIGVVKDVSEDAGDGGSRTGHRASSSTPASAEAGGVVTLPENDPIPEDWDENPD